LPDCQVERGMVPWRKKNTSSRGRPKNAFSSKNFRVGSSVAWLVITRNGRPAVASGQGQDLLGVNLEERLVGHRTDGKQPLGQVESQPRALAAGDDEDGNLAAVERLSAAALRVGVTPGRDHRRWRDAIRRRHGVSARSLLVQGRQLIEVEGC
jgi:hypothetical protein